MEEKKKIIYFIKTTKSKYVEDIMKKGRFCFNHPSIFNKWENDESAQHDPWDSHSARKVSNIVVVPLLRDDKKTIKYGKAMPFLDTSVIHLQTSNVKQTPICCFRYVEPEELTRNPDESIDFSLGKTAERIMKEFGHDSFVLIAAVPFLERMRNKYNYLSGKIVYHDLLNDFSFNVQTELKETMEQIFRKDKKYEWQKEYRIALQPTNETPVFTELGSIEDIAITGKLEYLKGIIRLRE